MLVFVDSGMCVGQTYLSAATDTAKDQERLEMLSSGKQEERVRHFKHKLEISIPVDSPLSSSTYSFLLGVTVPLGDKETLIDI